MSVTWRTAFWATSKSSGNDGSPFSWCFHALTEATDPPLGYHAQDRVPTTLSPGRQPHALCPTRFGLAIGSASRPGTDLGPPNTSLIGRRIATRPSIA